jgi:hypothetical protein
MEGGGLFSADWDKGVSAFGLRPIFHGKPQLSMFDMTQLVSKHLK